MYACFVIGCGRSATTAYARMLATATNAEIHVEQAPKLRIASRELIKGRLADPEGVLLKARREIIQETRLRGKKYGDKNMCYMPFIPYLFRLWDCKIVFLLRDPRDVVRSVLSRRQISNSNFYQMPEDGVFSTKGPEDDPWDYSRLRPNPGDSFHDSWKDVSLFEKAVWNWTQFNEQGLAALAKCPAERWRLIDVTFGTIDLVEQTFDFLELTGFDPKIIERMLESRINSIQEKSGRDHSFPAYPHWTKTQKEILMKHAGRLMGRLGYEL